MKQVLLNWERKGKVFIPNGWNRKLNKRLKSEYNQIEKILALLTRKRQKEINNDPNNELD